MQIYIKKIKNTNLLTLINNTIITFQKNFTGI